MELLKMKTLEEFFAHLEGQIAEVRYYESGKIDNHGNVVGVKEFPEGAVPHSHQAHHLDEYSRVLRLDKYEREFSKPTRRFYFYDGPNPKVLESVWFDRYGRLDNVHRYIYCARTGLMTERAEYSKDGGLHYRILSSYDDMDHPSPKLIENKWLDRLGNLIKRYEYDRNDVGDVLCERSFGKADELIGYYEFTYDGDRLLRKDWFNASGELMSYFTYDFDEDERVKEAILHSDGKVDCRQEFIYDETGNVVVEKWFDADGNLMKQLRY